MPVREMADKWRGHETIACITERSRKVEIEILPPCGQRVKNMSHSLVNFHRSNFLRRLLVIGVTSEIALRTWPVARRHSSQGGP